MDIFLLLKSIVALSVILGVLIFFLIYSSKKKKQTQQTQQKKENKNKTKLITFESLVKVIKDKNSTPQELDEALKLIIEKYGKIKDKVNGNPHEDFYRYGDIILHICHHPNTNKNLIVKFVTALEKKNKSYSPQINKALKTGLDTRRH